PRRASYRAVARFGVRNRDRPQRVAHKVGSDELPTAWPNREGAWSKTRKIEALTLRLTTVSLGHKHGEAFAGPARLDEFAHRQWMATVAAILKRRHQPRRAFGENYVAPDDDRVA